MKFRHSAIVDNTVINSYANFDYDCLQYILIHNKIDINITAGVTCGSTECEFMVLTAESQLLQSEDDTTQHHIQLTLASQVAAKYLMYKCRFFAALIKTEA